MERFFTRFIFQYDFPYLFLLPESLGNPSFRPDGLCFIARKNSAHFQKHKLTSALKRIWVHLQPHSRFSYS
jgi:hypothetical protein